MAGAIRLTPKERRWSEKAIERMGGDVTHKKVRELGLSKEFKDKFGRSIKDAGMYTRLYNMAYPGGKSKSKKPERVFEKSEYLVYIKDVGVNGFETEDEVKAFLEKSKILGNVKVFKNTPVVLEYKIKIG